MNEKHHDLQTPIRAYINSIIQLVYTIKCIMTTVSIHSETPQDIQFCKGHSQELQCCITACFLLCCENCPCSDCICFTPHNLHIACFFSFFFSFFLLSSCSLWPRFTRWHQCYRDVHQRARPPPWRIPVRGAAYRQRAEVDGAGRTGHLQGHPSR